MEFLLLNNDPNKLAISQYQKQLQNLSINPFAYKLLRHIHDHEMQAIVYCYCSGIHSTYFVLRIKLDQMTSRSSFQPKLFYNRVLVYCLRVLLQINAFTFS